MPRFFFHVKDGLNYRDLQGTELPDVAAARQEALRFTSALLGEKEHGFWDGVDWSMDVKDEQQTTLFTLTFAATNLTPT